MDSVWWSGEKQECKLQVSDKAKYYLERDVPANIEILEEHESHSIVRMNYHNEIELFSYVKGWIPEIRIIDNQILSNKLSVQLQTFLSDSICI